MRHYQKGGKPKNDTKNRGETAMSKIKLISEILNGLDALSNLIHYLNANYGQIVNVLNTVIGVLNT